MDAVWVVAIITIVVVIVGGLLASITRHGDTNNQHLPSVISRIIDWMF
jgi:hypothetical protein